MQYKKVKDIAEKRTVNVWDGCNNTKQGGQGRAHAKVIFERNIKRDQGATMWGKCSRQRAQNMEKCCEEIRLGMFTKNSPGIQ